MATEQAHSVSSWIVALKAGDKEAAQLLWERYAKRLVELAKRRLGDTPKRVADEEDIAQSVFRVVCHGAEEGRFRLVTDRDELWWLLLAITRQKVIDHIRRETAQKRGVGRVLDETALAAGNKLERTFTLDSLVGEDPTPELLAILNEESQRLLGLLGSETLQRIAMSRIQGYTVPEIAVELAISSRSVERKLRLIRSTWAHDFSCIGGQP